MNPFVVEDVVPNGRVSEFVNQTRYSGGVAGLGQRVPAQRQARGLRGLGAFDFGEGIDLTKGTKYEWKNGAWVAIGDASTASDEYVGDVSNSSSSVVVQSPPKPKSYKITPVATTSNVQIEKVDEEPSGGGGGFFSSLMDVAGKMFTGAAQQPTSYNLNQPQPSSPWPWVVGGVAVAGLVVFALTRSKK